MNTNCPECRARDLSAFFASVRTKWGDSWWSAREALEEVEFLPFNLTREDDPRSLGKYLSRYIGQTFDGHSLDRRGGGSKASAWRLWPVG